jgi:group I intron endonuclease
MQTTFIYTLLDPVTNQIRYIGKANNLDQRYKAHLNKTRKHQIHKRNWINSLKKQGLKPIIEILDVVPIAEWQFWETYWISQFKSWGFDLINYTSGGDGCTFANQTSFKKGQNKKPVVALTLTGEFVEEFESAKDGNEFCGKKCVVNALLRKIKRAGNYLWLYKSDYEKMSEYEIKAFVIWCNTKKELKANSGSFKKGIIPWSVLNKGFNGMGLKTAKRVLQLDHDNNIIKVYRSVKEASVEFNCCHETIRSACINNKIYKNFKWKYE